MQVIGAGLSRTGTLSTRAALERLGYPCYHMTETARAAGHLDAWLGLTSGQKTMDWPALFKDYDATVDLPACLFYRELAEAFPDAKILLNVRDRESWYDSLMRLSTALGVFRPFVSASADLEKFLHLTDVAGHIMTNGDFSREGCLKAFEAHNAAVERAFPAERLLVFRVQDGWAPLCRFLGHPVPDEPFPYLNEGQATIRAFVSETFGVGPVPDTL